MTEVMGLPGGNNKYYMGSEKYKFNETVTLTATDTECCAFDYWALSDDPCKPVSYDNPLVISAKTKVSYIAKFKKKKFTVNVSTSYPGIVIIKGNGVYNCGDDVKIVARYPDCLDIYWSDASLETGTSYEEGKNGKTLYYTIESISSDFYGTLIGDVLTAHVTVSPCPSDGGDVGIVYFPSLQNNTLSCNGQSQQQWSICEHAENGCSVGTEGDFICGDVITLIARPDTDGGYVFNGWGASDCEKGCNDSYVSTNPIYTTNVCSDIDYVACFSTQEPKTCHTLQLIFSKTKEFCYIVEINFNGDTYYVTMNVNDVLYFPDGCDIKVHIYGYYGANPVHFPIFQTNIMSNTNTLMKKYYWGFTTSGNNCCQPRLLSLNAKEDALHGLYELSNAHTDILLDEPMNFIDNTSGLVVEDAYPAGWGTGDTYIGDYFCNIPSDYLGCQQTPTPVPECLALRVWDVAVHVKSCFIVEISVTIEGQTEVYYITMTTGNTLYFPSGSNIKVHFYNEYLEDTAPNVKVYENSTSILPQVEASYYLSEYGWEITSTQSNCLGTKLGPTGKKYVVHSLYEAYDVTNDLTLTFNGETITTTSVMSTETGYPIACNILTNPPTYNGLDFCNIVDTEFLGCYQAK